MEREQELENKGRSSGTRTHACRRRKMTDQRRRRCGRERASVDAERNGDAKKWKSMKRRQQEERERRRRRQLWRLGFHFFIHWWSKYHPFHIRQQPEWGGYRKIPHPPKKNCLWIRVSKSIAKTHPTPSFDIYIHNHGYQKIKYPVIKYNHGSQKNLQKSKMST